MNTTYPMSGSIASPLALRYIAALLFAAVIGSIGAQVFTSWASTNGPGGNIVHISGQWQWSNGMTITAGYYPNGIQPDDSRVNSGNAIPLISTATTDAALTASYQAFVQHATTTSYGEITNNCGAAIDAAAAAVPSISSWGQSNAHNNTAIWATTFNTIANTVSSWFSSAYSAIQGWFSE